MTQVPSRPAEVHCPHCGQAHPRAWTHCPNTGKALSSGRALVGRIIADRYRVVGLLGEGGMGAVYAAEHTLIGRRVAIKRLHPELAQDASSIARFQREARAAAMTGHENIVDILDLGFAEDGAPYLVMEYLRGESLARTLAREQRLAAPRACYIVGQALAALDAVHARGIVHRDLKPDNIFLTRRAGRKDYVKVLDFGVSKMRTSDEVDATQLTRTGVTVGTPHYMSPEQARGMKNHDHRVDVYAAGVILYEALTARLPFEGDNYHALLQSILVGTMAPVDALVPGIQPELAEAVHRALSRDPDARYPSARAMLEELVPFGALDVEERESAPPGPDLARSETALMDRPVRAVTPTEPATPHRPIASVAPVLPRVGARASQRPAAHRVAHRAPDAAAPREAAFPRARRPLIAPRGDALRPVRLDGPPRRFEARSSDWSDGTSRPASGSRPAGQRSDPPPRVTSLQVGRSTPQTGGTTRVKAILVAAAVAYLREAYGPRATDRVIARLPPEAIERIRSVLLPVSWVPFLWFDALLREADQTLGRDDGTLAAGIGAAIADRELPTTHRLFIQSATPTMAVQRIPQLFRSYHERASARVTGDGNDGWTLELMGLEPDSHTHATSMGAFFARMLELTGARDVRIRVARCRERGDTTTTLSIRWRETHP